MNVRRSIQTAMLVGWALLAIAAEVVAEQQQPEGAAVKVIKDVSYGPHGERNQMDFYLPETGTVPRPLVICIHGGGWAGGDKSRYAWLSNPPVNQTRRKTIPRSMGIAQTNSRRARPPPR